MTKKRKIQLTSVIVLTLLLVGLIVFTNTRGNNIQDEYKLTDEEMAIFEQRDDQDVMLANTTSSKTSTVRTEFDELPKGQNVIILYGPHCWVCEATHKDVKQQVDDFIEQNPELSEYVSFVPTTSPLGQMIATDIEAKTVSYIAMFDTESRAADGKSYASLVPIEDEDAPEDAVEVVTEHHVIDHYFERLVSSHK